MSALDDFLSLSFSMEDTFDFSFDSALEVEPLSFPPPESVCLPVSSLHCGTPGDLKAELKAELSPTPGLDEEGEQDLPLIPESEDQLSMDEGLKEQLVEIGISDFNKRVKALGLDTHTVQILRTLRKKAKNRLAAIRSRSRKETRLNELEKRVIQLQTENKSQHQLILQLQERLRKAEQVASKGN